MTAEKSVGLIKLTNAHSLDEQISIHHNDVVSVARDSENPAFVKVICSDGQEFCVTESLEEVYNLLRNCI